MRHVIWTDKDGRKHRSFVKDNYDDAMAPQGIPGDPPDIYELDWERIKLKLHNALVDRRLFVYQDVVSQQHGVTGAILSALRGDIIALYKERRER